MPGPLSDPLIGTTVSQYEIVAKLGGGGMGVVYRARDLKLSRPVALKFLPPQWSHDEGAKQRFMREAQAASATHHRNICVIHNIDETPDGRLFIVMAYYEGETLKQRLERGALPLEDLVEIAAEIAEGLAKAHSQGVVHRDVKPGNIILTDDGAKILDFGLAKFADALQLTVPGSTIGTVAYMSPEQVRGEEADARSDIWAFGVVLYEMLTGAVPFRGAYPEATFHAIKNEPVPPLHAARPDTPDALERTVMRALEKDVARRFQSAREPARELRLLQGRTVPLELRTEEVAAVDVRSVAAAGRARPVRRRRVRAYSALATILALAVGFGWYWWSNRPVERIKVAIVPVANHTGESDLDRYRLALTQTLVDELAESPNIKVVPYVRLLEIVRPFITKRGDVSSSDAVQAIATASGAPFLVVPTLVYRDRDRTWLVHIQIRNSQTGTTGASYETASLTSSLSQQTAFRLITTAADYVQQHFKKTGPGRSFVQRADSSRFREPDAALAFESGLNAYEQMEYRAAVDAFTEAATLDDQHAQTFAWLSRGLLLLSRRNEAVAAARRAKSLVTAQASPLEIAFVDATVSEALGDSAAAEKAYGTLVGLDPDSSWALTELADFLKRRQDRNSQAIEAYSEVLRVDGSYIRPHLELCQLYTRIDDFPLADREAERALVRFREAANMGAAAQALLCRGDARREAGNDLPSARQSVAEARQILEQLNQPYSLARAVFYQGLVEFSANEFMRAGVLFEEALARVRETGNLVTEAVALMNLGVVNFYSGQPTRALEFFTQSGDAFRRLGDERRAAEMEVNTAGLEVEYGVAREGARRKLANARTNLEKLGHIDFQLNAMQIEADALRYAGSLARAATLLRSALEMARGRQLAGKITSLSASLALTEIEAGNYGSAHEVFSKLAPDLETADTFDAETRIALGVFLTRVGAARLAVAHLEKALIDVESRQSLRLLPAVHVALASAVAGAGGDAAAVRAHLRTARAAWVDPLPNAAIVEADCHDGWLQSEAGERQSGVRSLSKGIADAERLGRLGLEARCRIRLAETELRRRQPNDALAALSSISASNDERTIGTDLLAQLHYWRGRALSGSNQATADAELREAQRSVEQLRDALPATYRASFQARPDLQPLFLASSARH